MFTIDLKEKSAEDSFHYLESHRLSKNIKNVCGYLALFELQVSILECRELEKTHQDFLSTLARENNISDILHLLEPELQEKVKVLEFQKGDFWKNLSQHEDIVTAVDDILNKLDSKIEVQRLKNMQKTKGIIEHLRNYQVHVLFDGYKRFSCLKDFFRGNLI